MRFMVTEPMEKCVLKKGGGRKSMAVLTRKARISLNFKGIDYETQWLEYPDVAPTLKSL